MEPAKTKSRSALEPAASIIRKLGGEAAIVELTGVAYTAPYRWQASRDKGGTGGLIPQRYHRRLIDHARANGIDLRAEDFLEVPGRISPSLTPTEKPERARAS